MASSQAQQQTGQSPFKLFSRVAWNKGSKKSKQASLGEENNMYYHPELKRWVEKGKEEEAEREAAGPPPPPVLSSGSITSAPLSKRSLSQRYVLQPNLSISSSMASMAGSLSQTDLAGLVSAGLGDGYSGPPSAIGSTAPSPPQSSNCLVPQGSLTSGPPSATGLGSATGSFFVPPPPQRTSSQPVSGGFFVPPPPTPEDVAEGPAELAGDGPVVQQQVDEDATASGNGEAAAAMPEREVAAPSPTDHSIHGNGNVPDFHSGAAGVHPHAAAQNGSVCGNGAGDTDSSGWVVMDGSVDGPAAAVDSRPPESPVSFPDALELQEVGSPVTLSAATSTAGAPPQPPLQPLMMMARDFRRVGGAANASDGGAAISLHEGMGVTPARPHVAQACEVVAANGFEPPAEGMDETEAPVAVGSVGVAVGKFSPLPAEGVDAAGGEVAESLTAGDQAVAAVGIPATAGDTVAAGETSSGDAEADVAGGSGAGYSQYYYQQYAYLYQYAVEQGYAEADAVGYAQYYAAVYAQQYEAQAPEGHLGGDASAAGAEGGAEAAPSAAAERPHQPQAAADDELMAVAASGLEAASAVAAAASTAVTEVVGANPEPAWQVAAVAAEDEARAVMQSGNEPTATPAEADNDCCGDDPVYVMAAPPAHITLGAARSAVPEAAPEAKDGTVQISAAPLPADLTAAANAAAQHHQSAVTAAVAAAAAAVELQLQAGGLFHTDGAVPALGAGAMTAAQSAGVGLTPQLLLGLGAAGAKRLTQLSSVVTSLGATVAGTAPVAAALSAAASTAAAAAAVAGGFAGLETGLSDDDFERIMHPGDPAKLDGPLPWELPEHLRTGRKFLALCANWQLANPGQPYAPHLLLQQEPHDQQTQHQQEVASQEQAVAVNGGDVALAAEGGSGSTGGSGHVAAAQEQQQPVVEELSSYERACQLSRFGQPAAALLPAKPTASTAAAATPTIELELPPPRREERHHPLPSPSTDSEPSAPNGEVLVEPAESLPEAIAEPAAAPPVGHVPLSQQLLQQTGPLDKPAPEGPTPEDTVAEEHDAGEAATVEHSAVSTSLVRLGTVETASFFEQLGEQAQTPAAAKPEVEALVAGAGAAAVSGAAVENGDQDGDEVAPAATAAAAAAIDSVVQALEQLRSSAAAGNGDAVADPVAGTALLLQIQSSLAQATEALAGMGVDVGALAALAGLSKFQTPATPTEWTPNTSHKRPRVDASPATPTRVAGTGTPTEGVVTPLLAPGPPGVRPVSDEDGAAAAAAPGERFQQLGRRLSNASVEAAAQAATKGGAGACQPQQPEAIVLSLTLASAPEVDVAAVEERVRSEERVALEARLESVVDSEREAAALVIAAVERERDGLQQRVEELEQALAAATAERDGLAQRLDVAEAGCRQARTAGEGTEAERGALAARLLAVTAERDELATQLAAERSEKAALAEALSSARAESEELRQRYAERFGVLSLELEATRGSLAELQGEHDELLLCLGQESTKVEVLTDALRDAGGDPDPLIQRVEAEYETMGLGQGGGSGEDEGQGGQGEEQQPAAEAAGEGWECEELAL